MVTMEKRKATWVVASEVKKNLSESWVSKDLHYLIRR